MRKMTSTNTINKTHLEETCGMAYAISLIGGRWKLSILGELSDYGRLRYNDLRNRLPGISDRMLTRQLKELEENGLVTRTVVPQVPVKVEYELSQRGESLRGILYQISEWGERELGAQRMGD